MRNITFRLITSWWNSAWWKKNDDLSSSSEGGKKDKPAKTKVWSWEVEGPSGLHFSSNNGWEIRITHWTERWGIGHRYHDYHLQYSCYWFSQLDTWEKTSQEAVGHQRCSRPLWWEGRFEEETVWSRRRKRKQGCKQEDSEGSEESKGGLDRCSVQGDYNLPEQKQQQESKKACQLVKALTWEKQGRSSLIQDKFGKYFTEEQEILSRWTAYMYCSELYKHESLVTTQYWTAVVPGRSLQSILREEVEIAVASRKGESLPELIIYQQNLFKLTGRPSSMF